MIDRLHAHKRTGPLIRDLAVGLRQQMYLWGLDVKSPSGNLLQDFGFGKRPSDGLQGTSCYALPWENGVIELHGSHAGWFGDGGGFLFIRPMHRCVRWLTECAPVPGHWPKAQFVTRADEALHEKLVPFLSWWIAYEQRVEQQMGPAYRERGYRQHRKLPKSRAWLPPAVATEWIAGLRDHPQSLPRAARFLTDSSWS